MNLAANQFNQRLTLGISQPDWRPFFSAGRGRQEALCEFSGDAPRGAEASAFPPESELRDPIQWHGFCREYKQWSSPLAETDSFRHVAIPFC